MQFEYTILYQSLFTNTLVERVDWKCRTWNCRT